MEEFVTNQIFPDWDIWGQYTIGMPHGPFALVHPDNRTQP